MTIDDVDRKLLAALQEDASQSYAALGQAAGLSAGSAHERVRKLKAAGVIRRTTIDVDPAAVGHGVLAFVLLEANAWMGESREALLDIPAVEEAHIIAGPASVLVKVRTATTEDLQATLRALHDVDGVTSTQTVVVLESFFERQPAVV
jgi:DNA-binding Lrp family transcriptional regulator